MGKETFESAVAIRRSANEQIQAIQADKDLTEVAKGQRVGKIRNNANIKLAELKNSNAEGNAAQVSKLKSRLFGLSYKFGTPESEKLATQQSFRDALFRAESVTKAEQAARYFEQAKLAGDKLFLKALAAISYERGWHNVVAQYAGTSEAVAENLNELSELEQARVDRQKQFAERMFFGQIPETNEERQARVEGAPVDSPSAA
jgi:hypothetical protein